MPSTDCSHLSRAEPALMVTLCSPPHPASALAAGRGPFELPLEPWVFPTCPFSHRLWGSPENWNKVVSCQDGAGVGSGFGVS